MYGKNPTKKHWNGFKQHLSRNNNPEILGIHRFFTSMEFGEKQLMVKLTVKETLNVSDNNSLYTVEAVDVMSKKSPEASWKDAVVGKDANETTSNPSSGEVNVPAQAAQEHNNSTKVTNPDENAPEASWKGADINSIAEDPSSNTSSGAMSWLEAAMAEEGIGPDGGIAVNPLAEAIAEHNANIENGYGNPTSSARPVWPTNGARWATSP